ncbi:MULTISPECIES: ABC transporter permease [Haloarcula]|uniref:ABC transporter substrate-binding protein n=1 Tax=Haloarcula pellucida TaxID=1427151 RepID=A0A830GIL9_9EURY|nr:MULTISPECIES: ABC transporter permease [Halomicroarcula]MDS0277012.1 ABC transporter permease [Halomicroarcula sp. S1AR25-4]GGN87055.1 ABC transporter substrate-binding protein [Halomicroarcula pellucida]
MLDPLYRRFPSVLMARRNLTRTKMRSLLASLGIVIGVIAIASLGMFGVALQYSFTQNLGDLGNQVTVSPNRDAGVTSLSERDIREIQRVAGPGVTVSPVKQGIEPVAYDRKQNTSEFIYGLERPSEVYNASEGRVPEPFRSGALVGTTIAEEHDLHPGSTIAVNGTTVRVRAVLESGDAFSRLNPDSRLILPPSYFHERGYAQVYVTARTGTQANETASAIRGALNDREQRVTVNELGSLVDTIEQQFQIINTVLVGIASISLLVAGISILNVMLMSTVERREEIGVLRAVGYQKRDVLKVMLTEATLLGIVGGLVGVVLSLGAGLAINHYTVGDAMAVFRLANAWYLLAAFGFAVVTSIVSGLYPAWKAASEEPVEALRG